jgi:hypothetical protein
MGCDRAVWRILIGVDIIVIFANSITAIREQVITESGPMFFSEDVTVGKFAICEYMEPVASNCVIFSLLNHRNYWVVTKTPAAGWTESRSLVCQISSCPTRKGQ